MKIILSGYMGSGKSAVGDVLAEKTKLNFIDLDQEISKREGRGIKEIFSESGEIYFRKKESEVLKDLLNSDTDFILSLGGGTPCYGKNLSLMKEVSEGELVYLKTSLDELTRRLEAEKDSRPLIQHLQSREELEDFIRKHLFERTYYYNQSDLIISTDGKAIEDIAEEIFQKLS